MRDKFITIDNTNYQGDDDVNEIINIDLINFNESKSSIHNNTNSNNNNNDDQFLKYFHQLIIDKYKIFKIILQFTKTNTSTSSSTTTTINGTTISNISNNGNNNSIEINSFNQELFNLIKSSNDNILNFANYISTTTTTTTITILP